MLDGIIIVYKEAGFTSNDVVAKMRGICRQRKIGHTGTLDPEATGVLPLCLGSGTKLCDMLTEKDKEYVAELLLGVTTDTQDCTGTVLQEREVNVTEEAVREACMGFVGEYDQVPPMYSALKVNGKKLYELAREGKEIERKARRVQILELEILEMHLPIVKMRVICSKGTYIRTLCADIGEKLGCGGTMKSLERTRVGRFLREQAHTLTQLEQIRDSAGLESVLLPVEDVFAELDRLVLKPEFDIKLENGNAILPSWILRRESAEGGTGRQNFDVAGSDAAGRGVRNPDAAGIDAAGPDGHSVRMCLSDGTFKGIYTYDAKSRQYRTVKMFL